ncbi:MAG: hypothetical protein OEY14_18910 [Myxococcales bacterium]|nr:hypothetical protein [Myxococcales bacterium]
MNLSPWRRLRGACDPGGLGLAALLLISLLGGPSSIALAQPPAPRPEASESERARLEGLERRPGAERQAGRALGHARRALARAASRRRAGDGAGAVRALRIAAAAMELASRRLELAEEMRRAQAAAARAEAAEARLALAREALASVREAIEPPPALPAASPPATSSDEPPQAEHAAGEEEGSP